MQAAPRVHHPPYSRQPASVTRLLQTLAEQGRHGLQDAQQQVVLKNLTYPELEQLCLAAGES